MSGLVAIASRRWARCAGMSSAIGRSTQEPIMKTIEIDQLQSVCGGTSAYDYCVQGVEKKALYYGGMYREDGKLTVQGARDLISSVQGNGFHRCERQGLRNVLENQSMTGGAKRKIGSFLSAVD